MESHDPRKSKVRPGSIFRLYSREIIRQPFRFIFILVGVVGAQACSLIIPLYMRQMFNTLVGTDTSPLVVQQAS